MNNKNPLKVILIILIVIFIILSMAVGGFIWWNQPAKRIERLLDLGQKYLAEMNYDQSIITLEQALRIDPKNSLLYSNLAEIYVAKADHSSDEEEQLSLYESANENFKNALYYAEEDDTRLDNAINEFYLNWSKIYIERDDYVTAKKILSQGFDITENEALKSKLDEVEDQETSEVNHDEEATLLSNDENPQANTSGSGKWIQSGSDWYYIIDDGNYAKDAWLWIDKNHDGKAEFYHFDANGVMSKSTEVYIYGETVYFDENGAMINDDDGSVYSEDVPSYSINMVNGNYEYSLNNNDSHYNFKEIKFADINTDNLVNWGEYYSCQIRIEVCFMGSGGGVSEVMNCYIPATAYFSKNCMVKKSYPENSIPIPISSINFQDDEFYSHVTYVRVESVDSNGYVTSCTMGWAN